MQNACIHACFSFLQSNFHVYFSCHFCLGAMFISLTNWIMYPPPTNIIDQLSLLFLSSGHFLLHVSVINRAHTFVLYYATDEDSWIAVEKLINAMHANHFQFYTIFNSNVSQSSNQINVSCTDTIQ